MISFVVCAEWKRVVVGTLYRELGANCKLSTHIHNFPRMSMSADEKEPGQEGKPRECLADVLYKQSIEYQRREEASEYNTLLRRIESEAKKSGVMSIRIEGAFSAHVLQMVRDETKLKIVPTHEPAKTRGGYCGCDHGCSECVDHDWITVSWDRPPSLSPLSSSQGGVARWV